MNAWLQTSMRRRRLRTLPSIPVETGDTEAVEWFVGQVLDASRYPDGFPRRHQVAYWPENQDVVVEFELSPQQVVPTVRGYRYVKMRDAIDPLPRPENEVKQRYARLIACVALRTLHEIFAATPGPPACGSPLSTTTGSGIRTSSSGPSARPAADQVIGRLPGETTCLTLVWAVLDRASRGWRGLTMTSDGLRLLQDLRRPMLDPPRQLRPRAVSATEDDERPENVSAA